MGLFKRDVPFFEQFEAVAEVTVDAARVLEEFFANPSEPKAATQRIKDLEHKADAVTHKTMDMLHESFITPIDRSDIHLLVTRLDDIVDDIDATADRVYLYRVEVIPDEAKEMARVLTAAAMAVQKAVIGLRTLKEPQDLLRTCVEIKRLENEADAVLRRALAGLFNSKKDALEVIKWKELYETMESAVDRCEDVANVIEGIVIEHA